MAEIGKSRIESLIKVGYFYNLWNFWILTWWSNLNGTIPTYTKEVVLVVGHNDGGGGGDDDEDGLIDSFDPFRPNPFDFDIILIKIF